MIRIDQQRARERLDRAGRVAGSSFVLAILQFARDDLRVRLRTGLRLLAPAARSPRPAADA